MATFISKEGCSRKRCKLTTNSEVFFSLVDYRNCLFTSNNGKNILEFYDSFKNREDLIEWMRERPKGATYVHEVEGNKNIIVVITTADFYGENAKKCKDIVFKGLQIIFVESGEVPDFYFNAAHNANIGIKEALEYNPEWIIYSNDDVETDNIQGLITILKSNPRESYLVPLRKNTEAQFQIFDAKFPSLLAHALFSLFSGDIEYGVSSLKMLKVKFWAHNGLFFSAREGILYKFLKFLSFPVSLPYENFSDFGIFRATVLREFKFEESFINGVEDTELTLRLINCGIFPKVIPFKVRSAKGGGQTLGDLRSLPRHLRDYSNLILLKKIVKEFSL